MVNTNPMISPEVNPNQEYVPISQSCIPQQNKKKQKKNGMM